LSDFIKGSQGYSMFLDGQTVFQRILKVSR
jgi:hypothetical protein